MENQIETQDVPTTSPAPQLPAKRPANGDMIRKHLESEAFLHQLKLAMPDGKEAQQLMRGALTSMQKNPDLAKADQHSFFAALLTIAQLGLRLNGREAHLAPFWSTEKKCFEVVPMPDYKGLIRLAIESGSVSFIHADVVCFNDKFRYNKGQIEYHDIELKEPRGKVYAAYAFCRFKDGSEKPIVMQVDDIEAHRRRSRNPDKGPWAKDWTAMALKTCVHQLMKWVPLSPKVADALDADETLVDTSIPVSTPPALEIPQRAQITSGEPADGLQKRGPGRPKKPASDVPPHVQALERYARESGLTVGEIASAAVEFQFGELRATFSEFTQEEADAILKNADGIKTAILESRNAQQE
jgi:recombination protein RecT